MRVKIIADIRKIDNDGTACVACEVRRENGVNGLLPVAFEAILKSMKDANKGAFYDAMTNFIDEELEKKDDD